MQSDILCKGTIQKSVTFSRGLDDELLMQESNIQADKLVVLFCKLE